MGKDNSNIINMSATLFIITAVAAVTLASVYSVTKEPIAKAKAQKQEMAIKEVLPVEFDRIESKEIPAVDMPNRNLLFNIAYKGDEIVGYAINTLTMKGFSGQINAMVGISPEGTIFDTYLLEHKETPGLGTKLAEPKFKDQLKNFDPNSKKLLVKQDGGDVDAITAATISARAFLDAIQRALDTYKNMEENKHE